MQGTGAADRFRISVIAGGSRGDIEPYIALAGGLHARGYAVRLGLSPRYESAVRAAGLEFSPIADSDPPRTPEGRANRAAANRSVRFFLRSMQSVTADSASQRFADGWDACRDAQLILSSPLALLMTYSVAEKIGVPLVRAFYSPASPTGRYPAMIVPPLRGMPRGFNLWTHHMVPRLVLLRFRAQVDRARRDVLGLGPITSDPLGELDDRRVPVLYGYSPAVCPPPPEFGDWIHVTGYWHSRTDPRWQPPPGLVRFLGAGPPPVYVGFGSMADARPSQLSELVAAALARAGQRGVLATGWGGLGPIDAPHVHVVDEAPHDWLFPQLSAVVHHGGAGTTGAGLRAGLPTVIVPFGMPDQPFWGGRVAELGVGAPPIRRRQLTVARLADAIRGTTQPAMRERAADLGRRISGEDGIARATDAIDAYVGRLGYQRST